jgi:hypothetical protein
MGQFEPSTDSANQSASLSEAGRKANSTGPDFLCAGMPKAGTGWLFEQLFHHPDFWMSPIKEYHYFDTDFPKSTFVDMIKDARENPELFNRRRGRQGFPKLTERDWLFFEDVLSCTSGGTDLEEYARLFRHKNGQLSGDMTPGYCCLNEQRIARIAEAFPDLKIVFLIRDPVSRCWSRLQMRERRGGFLENKLEDAEKFRSSLARAEESVAGMQTKIFARWKAHFPESNIQHFYFDEIARTPRKLRRKVLRFLGADASQRSGDVAPNFNAKSQRKKVPMPDELKEILVEYFTEEMFASVEVFGPRARAWLRQYGLSSDGDDHIAEENDDPETD